MKNKILHREPTRDNISVFTYTFFDLDFYLNPVCASVSSLTFLWKSWEKKINFFLGNVLSKPLKCLKPYPCVSLTCETFKARRPISPSRWSTFHPIYSTCSSSSSRQVHSGYMVWYHSVLIIGTNDSSLKTSLTCRTLCEPQWSFMRTAQKDFPLWKLGWLWEKKISP